MGKCPHEKAKILYKPVAGFQLGFSWSAACPWHPAPEPQTNHMSVCPGPGPVCLGRLLAPQGCTKLEMAVPCGLPTVALKASAAPALQSHPAVQAGVGMKPVQRWRTLPDSYSRKKQTWPWDSSFPAGINGAIEKPLWVCSAAPHLHVSITSLQGMHPRHSSVMSRSSS